MHFVNVMRSIPDLQVYRDAALIATKITGRTLMSLIRGYVLKNFGFDTMQRLAFEIRAFKKDYFGELYIDSGGFSIIKGDIPPDEIPMVIGCYNKFLELEHSHVDQIFSLDIPMIVKDEYAGFNTRSNILEYNRMSLMESKFLLEDPEIRRKFSFIYQFKTPEHYEIWSRLYDDLELSKWIMRRSVGGMVGLKDITKIRFAPFIAMAYRCLFDHQNGVYPEEPFFLHLLGIGALSDRFIMVLIDRLFNRYLEGVAPVIISYDSIAPNRHIQRTTKNHVTYKFENGLLARYNTLFDLPENFIKKIYFTDSMLKMIKGEIDFLRKGERLTTNGVLNPLGVYTEVALNRYFEHLVDAHDMAEMMLRRTSIIQVKRDLKPILNQLSLEQPDIFTKRFIENFIINVAKVFRFDQWYRNKRDRASLEELMRDFIDEINFPERLK